MNGRTFSDWLDDFHRRKNRNLPFPALFQIPASDWFASDRICVFHHIPKCSGTSVVNVLGRWFFLKEDYRAFVSGDWKAAGRISLDALRNRHCLTGHFDYRGIYLKDRYPEVLAERRYFLFTFVREPLDTKLSLFRYEKASGIIPDLSLEEHLLGRENYIAQRLPCTESDVDTVLGRYDFIGVTESIDVSLTRLAELVQRRPVRIPHLNRTDARPVEELISPALVAEFQRRNSLDYYIYHQAQRRLGR